MTRSCFASTVLIVFSALCLSLPVESARGERPASSASSQLQAALNDLDSWLNSGQNGEGWRQYLGLEKLELEARKGDAANPEVAEAALNRFTSGAPGLELPKFNAVRLALEAWLPALQQQYVQDFEKLALAARAGYQPITESEFQVIRAEMVRRARALEAWLDRNPAEARGWKKYLQWDLLEPHLAPDFDITRRSLADLDTVIQRFRSNQVGLELPAFATAAQAIVRYRSLASWATAARTRDPRDDYERLLTNVGAELQRHFQRSTTETAWKAGRILGVIDSLGRATDFVATIRRRFVQPNVSGAASISFIRRMPNRPIDQMRPVRDCILGTKLFGSARTLGNVQYELVPSDNTVELAVYLTGEAHSKTRGYNGPVRVNATGLTTFTAYRQISLSDDGFLASPATASADTRTQINSIQKLGGNFGRRLVEKIAWRQAMQKKRPSEIISARHAEQRIVNEFNQVVARDLGDLRRRYEEKIRNPLIRRAVSPEYLRMSSSPTGVAVETTFAARNQLAADSSPPVPRAGYDLVLQVHESAVNNYLPLALAGARISQQTSDIPPLLEGDVPNWIKVMSVARPKLAAMAATGAQIIEEAQEAVEAVTEGADDSKERELPPFVPYSITLNSEAPASVRFEDGQLAIRMRASALVSDDAEYTNWDFIIKYELTSEEDRIVLRRVGEIEVFPTGFDPAWDKQLTAQQSGFRSTLAKNMNARAEAGQSFPNEIPIEPIVISRLGALLVHEIKADGGWLTVSWILPPPGMPPAAPSAIQGQAGL